VISPDEVMQYAVYIFGGRRVKLGSW